MRGRPSMISSTRVAIERSTALVPMRSMSSSAASKAARFVKFAVSAESQRRAPGTGRKSLIGSA